jgi:ferredoxin
MIMQHYRVDPTLGAELAAFGGRTLGRCFSCGNCTAVCGLSKGDTVFPRKIIRYLQVGLADRLLESPEPWLCYYCGTCSETCPRDAEPGELMMAARRWLVSRYDWTGLSKRLYLSEAWEFGLLGSMALFVLALFLVPGWLGLPFGFAAINGAATEHVRLDLFAPTSVVHYGDLALAALLAGLLGINAARMIAFVRKGSAGLTIPLSLWLGKAHEFVVHGATQKRWLQCDNDARFKWLKHFVLVTGYATMLLLVVAFLPAFQRENAEFHWTSLLGYYSTATILGVTLLAMRSRLQKKEQYHKFSHASDWTFLVLLFLTALSGIVLHLFRLFDMPWPTYVLYVVHLMIAVPMLIIEVPFGKWNHLVFRPLAQYLVEVRAAAQARQPAPVAAPRHSPAHVGSR